MNNKLVDFVVCITENYILVQILSFYLTLYSKVVKWIAIFVLTFFALSIDTLVLPIASFGGCIILILYAIINYQNELQEKLYYSILVFSTNILLSSFLITLFLNLDSTIMHQLYNNGLFYFSLSFISRGCLLFIFLFFRNFKYEVEDIKNWNMLIFQVILFYASTLYILIADINANSSLSLLIIVSISTVFYFFSSYRHIKSQNLTSRKIIKSNMQAFATTNLDLNKFYEFLHDFRNLSILLRKSLESNDIDKAIWLLDNSVVNSSFSTISVEDKFLNYALNKNMIELKALGIPIKCISENSIPTLDSFAVITLFDLIFILIKDTYDIGNENINPYVTLITENHNYGDKVRLSFPAKKIHKIKSRNIKKLKNFIHINNGESVLYMEEHILNYNIIFLKQLCDSPPDILLRKNTDFTIF